MLGEFMFHPNKRSPAKVSMLWWWIVTWGLEGRNLVGSWMFLSCSRITKDQQSKLTAPRGGVSSHTNTDRNAWTRHILLCISSKHLHTHAFKMSCIHFLAHVLITNNFCLVWSSTWVVETSVWRHLSPGRSRISLSPFLLWQRANIQNVSYNFFFLSSVIVRVRVVFRKTVGGDWRFDYLSSSHLQMKSLWLWKMTITQVVEMSVTNNCLSEDYSHPDDHTRQTTRITAEISSVSPSPFFFW